MRRQFEYTISLHFAEAMVNCDTSGLTESDLNSLTEFESNLIERHGNAVIGVDFEDRNTETEFVKCDITGLFSDCIDVLVFEENKAKNS